ncbi:MAG: AMP-binding protein [Sciscionella sp.]
MLSRSAHVDTFCRDNLPPLPLWPGLEFTLDELHYPERLNAATALLDDIAAGEPDRPCLVSPTERLSYGQLRRRANQVAQVLTEDYRLSSGGRVLLRGPNNPWLVACWFGVIKAGGVVVTTMPLLRSAELSTLIELTRADIVLCDHRFAEELAGAARTPTTVLFGGEESDDLRARCAGKSGEFTNADTAADDVVMLAPTSGTTGIPKVTMHFHRDVLAVADTFAKYILAPSRDDVFTGTPPLAFTFGLGGLVIFPLRVGASTLLLEQADPSELADAVARHGVTVLFTAPTAYRRMLKAGKAPQLRGLRRCVSAGEHLPASVWKEFRAQTGVRIIDGIGATEMLHVFISAAGEEIRPGATGKAVPGYRAAILDLDGNPVPDGTAGQLAVVGPTGCRYLADDRQRAYVQHGWNVTGDTYIRDTAGYFWYQCRTDDMIISSGYNIAGAEVEEVLGAHPDVAECAVVGRADDERGMIVHAAVVLEPGVVGDPAKVRELQDFVKGEAAPYKYPRSIEFRSTLPRTPSGKLQRYRLREATPAQ